MNMQAAASYETSTATYHTQGVGSKASNIKIIDRRNCHLKHGIEGRTEGRIEVTGRKT
jgi:hypothetical protein